MKKKRNKSQNASLSRQAISRFKKWNDNRTDKEIEFAKCKSVKYWYVAEDGSKVMSFYKEEPKELKIYYNESGRAYVTSGRSHDSKTHYIHRLQAEAFPKRVYAYGKAKQHIRKKGLSGLEVHHTEHYTINVLECLETLEPKTHDDLFNKRKVPNISDNLSEHYKYMKVFSNITKENTSEQVTVVFSGSGIKDNVESLDFTQVIYADDFKGVTELAEAALKHKGIYLYICPETEEDREAYKKLLETPNEAEKLNDYICEIYAATEEPRFYTEYNNIKLVVEIKKIG